jgi:hypothetical protein
MTDNEKDRLRDDLMRRMKNRQRTIPESLNPHIYVMQCVDAMFAEAVDVLVEVKSEAAKGKSDV